MKNGVLLQAVISLLIAMCKEEYTFTASGRDPNAANIPYVKQKKYLANVDEDAHITSERVLAISDGVGGTMFSSKYMAKMLVNSADEAVTTSRTAGLNVRAEIAKKLFNKIKKYHQTIDGVLDKRLKQHSQTLTGNEKKLKELYNEKNHYGLFESSGTLVGCFIKPNSAGSPELRIFQTGDSLFMKLEKVYDDNNGGYYYYPQFVTNDMQRKFNHPKQINTSEIERIRKKLKEKMKLEVTDDILSGFLVYRLKNEIKEFSSNFKDTDLLVLGSDGLFDNLSTPMIVLCIAEALRLMENKMAAGEQITKPEELLHPFMDIFIQYLEQHSYNFYDQMLARQKERNAFVSLLNYRSKKTDNLEKNIEAEIESFKYDENETEINKHIDDLMLNDFDKNTYVGVDKINEYQKKEPGIVDLSIGITNARFGEYDLKKRYELLKQFSNDNDNDKILALIKNNYEIIERPYIIPKKEPLKLSTYQNLENPDLADQKDGTRGDTIRKQKGFRIKHGSLTPNKKSSKFGSNILGLDSKKYEEQRKAERDFLRGKNKLSEKGMPSYMTSTKASERPTSDFLSTLQSAENFGKILRDSKNVTGRKPGYTPQKNNNANFGVKIRSTLIKPMSRVDKITGSVLDDPGAVKLMADSSSPIENRFMNKRSQAGNGNQDMPTPGKMTIDIDNPRTSSLYRSKKLSINPENTPNSKSNRKTPSNYNMSKTSSKFRFPNDVSPSNKEGHLPSIGKNQFNKRLLGEENPENFECNILELMDFNYDSTKEEINLVPISQCVLAMLKHRKIKKDVLTHFGHGVVAKALAGASKYISVSDVQISPFGVKAMLFGQTHENVKQDDVSVIVSGIKTKTSKEPSDKSYSGQNTKTEKDLENDTNSFLKNLIVYSKNIEESASFYTTVLGLKVKHQSKIQIELEDCSMFNLLLRKAENEAYCSVGYSPILNFNVESVDFVKDQLPLYKYSIDSEYKEKNRHVSLTDNIV